MKLLECDGLSVGYDGKCVLSDINFSVSEGDYLCIVGENGSGKSTLVKTVLGLLKPIKGKINRNGIKNNVGYLPQQTPVQRDFPASVREVVQSGCLSQCGFRPFYTREEKKRAQENIDKMGLHGMEKRCYRELSGGQQQRVLLARALCSTRKILLLDEPVTGLDPKVTAELYDLIAALNKEGTAVIMISHDIGAAMKYASHILHIGSLVFFGTKEEYLASDVGKTFLLAGGKNDGNS